MAVQYNNSLSWFCQLAVPTVWWLNTMGNCRHKIKVLDIPLGWGGRGGGGGGGGGSGHK